MEQLGRLTLPTDADVVAETLRLKNLLGADALRDCDGTEMPKELLTDPAKKYATYYTTRKDNAWAEANPDEVQQEYLISDRHTARGTKLRIHLMDGFHTQQLKVNTLDDPKRWWEVIDRTTGEVVPTDKWFFDEPTGEVEIETVPYQLSGVPDLGPRTHVQLPDERLEGYAAPADLRCAPAQDAGLCKRKAAPLVRGQPPH